MFPSECLNVREKKIIKTLKKFNIAYNYVQPVHVITHSVKHNKLFHVFIGIFLTNN